VPRRRLHVVKGLAPTIDNWSLSSDGKLLHVIAVFDLKKARRRWPETRRLVLKAILDFDKSFKAKKAGL
jgi:hypothetical protein